AAVLVNAAGSVGAAAVAERDAAAFEVAEEFGPFLIGGGAVFLAGAQGAAAGDERPVAVDDLFGGDGLVSHGGVDVAVGGHELGGGIPCMIASVMSSLRKWCGANLSGWLLASVSPVRASAMSSSCRMAWAVIGRFSARSRRWNSSGIGGFQSRSLSS